MRALNPLQIFAAFVLAKRMIALSNAKNVQIEVLDK